MTAFSGWLDEAASASVLSIGDNRGAINRAY